MHHGHTFADLKLYTYRQMHGFLTALKEMTADGGK
jgi:hypothetical protein